MSDSSFYNTWRNNCIRHVHFLLVPYIGKIDTVFFIETYVTKGNFGKMILPTLSKISIMYMDVNFLSFYGSTVKDFCNYQINSKDVFHQQ